MSKLRDNQALLLDVFKLVCEHDGASSTALSFAERVTAREQTAARVLDAIDRALTATGPGSGECTFPSCTCVDPACPGCGVQRSQRWPDDTTHPNMEKLKARDGCYYGPVYGWYSCKVSGDLRAYDWGVSGPAAAPGEPVTGVASSWPGESPDGSRGTPPGEVDDQGRVWESRSMARRYAALHGEDPPKFPPVGSRGTR